MLRSGLLFRSSDSQPKYASGPPVPPRDSSPFLPLSPSPPSPASGRTESQGPPPSSEVGAVHDPMGCVDPRVDSDAVVVAVAAPPCDAPAPSPQLKCGRLPGDSRPPCLWSTPTAPPCDAPVPSDFPRPAQFGAADFCAAATTELHCSAASGFSGSCCSSCRRRASARSLASRLRRAAALALPLACAVDEAS